jgi:hypothetical protein
MAILILEFISGQTLTQCIGSVDDNSRMTDFMRKEPSINVSILVLSYVSRRRTNISSFRSGGKHCLVAHHVQWVKVCVSSKV